MKSKEVKESSGVSEVKGIPILNKIINRECSNWLGMSPLSEMNFESISSGSCSGSPCVARSFDSMYNNVHINDLPDVRSPRDL